MSTIEQRAGEWLAGTDIGASSKAIWTHMRGGSGPAFAINYPRDVADLGRCIRLLDRVPEWRPRMAEMERHGPYWQAIAARWIDLEGAYRRDMREGAEADAMIRSIVDPIEARDESVVRISKIAIMRTGAPKVRP